MLTTTLHAPVVAAPRRRRRIAAFDRMRAVIRQSRRHGIWIAVWSLVGWVGTALAPALSGEPFVLMMLAPRALFVALASDSVPLVPFVLLGTMRLGVTDASHFIIGKRFPSAVSATEVRPEPTHRWRRALRSLGAKGNHVCRWFCARPRIAGAFLFFRPNGKYLAVAGAYGVSARIAALSSVTGTAVFLTAMHIGVTALF